MVTSCATARPRLSGTSPAPTTTGNSALRQQSISLVGIFDRFIPKFVKRYADLGTQYREALAQYGAEVRTGIFPASEHAFTMKPEALRALTTDEGVRAP